MRRTFHDCSNRPTGAGSPSYVKRQLKRPTGAGSPSYMDRQLVVAGASSPGKMRPPGTSPPILTSSTNPGRPRYARSRKGVTLLFVISMIVLFLLMGTAFIVVSNQFYSNSRRRMENDRFQIDHTPIVENVFYQVLRGTDLDDRNSPFRTHSLIEDMYGYGFSTTIAASSANSDAHFIQVTLNSNCQSIIDNRSFSLAASGIPGNLSGHVLSFVDGRAKGLSTRIIDHQVTGTGPGSFTHRLLLHPHWMDSRFNVSNAGLLVNSRVIINGRPFAGTGAGHVRSRPLSDNALTNAALSPYLVGQAQADLVGTNNAPGFFTLEGATVLANSRGPNESYDTFDFQNMFLAGLAADGTPIEPSFHRQTLVNNSTDADFRAFTSGGPANDGVMVDNNNDGIPEGIWIDAGFSVRTSPQGLNYKPLVSVTVVDLDSRINVNAHGNRSHITPPIDNLQISHIPTLSTPLNQGQGMGPPEVRMDFVLGNGATSFLLKGNGAIPGRYGLDGKPGIANVRDTWSAYQMFGHPQASFSSVNPGTVGGHYGSAMDLFGRFGFAYPFITDVIDNTTLIGLPMGTIATSNLPDEITDSPYEMSFSSDPFFGPMDLGGDRLFTPKELEAILRPNDTDSLLLPQRLNLLHSPFTSTDDRNLVTVASFEVPTLPDNLFSRLYTILSTSNDGSSATALGIPNSTPNRQQAIRDAMRLMLPGELFRGLPMNVNRPFGDGADNDGDGAIDETGEQDSLSHPDASNNRFDHDNDGSTTGDLDTTFARANFARQLFVMTLLLTERVDRNGDNLISGADWFNADSSGGVTFADRYEYRRRIAQWCANVVDFRDPDSIMTAVEFDLNPFDGWDVDNDLTTTENIPSGSDNLRFVCWGAERPELLISETLATHDVRTQDLNFETTADGSAAGRISGANSDSDFDSHLVPKPTVFFELYNPWVINDANQSRPSELYDPGRNGVDLQRRSNLGNSPVWRLIVTETKEATAAVDDRMINPDDSTAEENQGNTPKIIRRIYFTRPSHDVGPEVFFPRPRHHGQSSRARALRHRGYRWRPSRQPVSQLLGTSR